MTFVFLIMLNSKKTKILFICIPLILLFLNTSIHSEEATTPVNNNELQELKKNQEKLVEQFHKLDKEFALQMSELEGKQKRTDEKMNELPTKLTIYVALSIIAAILVGLSAYFGIGIGRARDEAVKSLEKIRKDLKESKRVLKEIKKIREKTIEESTTVHSLAKKADELNIGEADKDKILKEFKNGLPQYLRESDELAEIKKNILFLEETQKESVSKLETRIKELSKIEKLAKEVNEKLPASHYYILGYDCLKLHKYEKAVKFYTKAIDLKSAYAEAYNDRGVSYLRLEKTDEALSDFNNAKKINPGLLNVYINLGSTYGIIGDYGKALSNFNKAIELSPNDFSGYVGRGATYEKLCRYEDAISEYNKSLEIKPDNGDAYNNRGYSYQKLGRDEEAFFDYRKAIELNPLDADACNNLGELFITSCKFEDAVKLLNENKKIFSTTRCKIISLCLIQLALASDGKDLTEYMDEYNSILREIPDFKLKDWGFGEMDDFLQKEETVKKISSERLKKMKEIHEEFKKLA